MLKGAEIKCGDVACFRKIATNSFKIAIMTVVIQWNIETSTIISISRLTSSHKFILRLVIAKTQLIDEN